MVHGMVYLFVPYILHNGCVGRTSVRCKRLIEHMKNEFQSMMDKIRRTDSTYFFIMLLFLITYCLHATHHHRRDYHTCFSFSSTNYMLSNGINAEQSTQTYNSISQPFNGEGRERKNVLSTRHFRYETNTSNARVFSV